MAELRRWTATASLTRPAVLLAILILAAVLRWWGWDYGLPHPMARPDEEITLEAAYQMFASGNPDPVSLPYPSFIVYLDVAALSLYYKVGEFLGRYDRRLDMLFDMVVLRPRFHYRVARTVNLVFGVATVALVYLLATTTFQTRNTGWLAALLLGTSLLHVIYSRFATVDVVTTFLATAAVLFAVRAASSSKTSSYVVAGMFAGLAASSKYNAAVVVSALILPVVAVLFGGEAKERARSLSNLAVAGLVTVLVFAVTSPFVVLHYEEVYRFVTHMGRVLTDAPDELALWVHLRDTFPRGLGWPFFAAAVVGLGRAGWRRRPEDLALVGFAVVYFAAIAGARIVYPRYVLPLIPVLAAFAAESSVWLAARFRHRAAATAVLTVLLVVPSLASSVRFDRLAARTDTRLLATEWIEENLPKRSKIALCRGYGAPSINSDRRRPPAFEPVTIVCSVNAILASGARYLVTYEYPPLEHRLASDVNELLARRATTLRRFDPFRADSEETPFFYRRDAFYLPLSGFGALERGGPIVTVWDMNVADESGAETPMGHPG